MTALLAKAGRAAPICSSMTWSDAAVVVAALTFLGFLAWAVLRGATR